MSEERFAGGRDALDEWIVRRHSNKNGPHRKQAADSVRTQDAMLTNMLLRAIAELYLMYVSQSWHLETQVPRRPQQVFEPNGTPLAASPIRSPAHAWASRSWARDTSQPAHRNPGSGCR